MTNCTTCEFCEILNADARGVRKRYYCVLFGEYLEQLQNCRFFVCPKEENTTENGVKNI